jgi:hypothetical protein
MPGRRMLREEAQCRTKATRKKKWAEYRQAKEATLGKPMRRVRNIAAPRLLPGQRSVAELSVAISDQCPPEVTVRVADLVPPA